MKEIGLRSYRHGQHAAAQRALRLATRLDPASRTAWLYLARSERDSGDLRSSLETISAALARHPDWAAGAWHAADLKLEMGDAEGAREFLLEVQSSEHEGEIDLIRIGRLATRAGASDIAARMAAGLLRRDRVSDQASEFAAEVLETVADAWSNDVRQPRAPAALRYRARTQLRLGRLEEALETAHDLEGTDPVPLEPLAREFREAGYEAYQDGDYERARTALEASVALNPGNRSACLYLARAIRNCGKLEDSLSTIEMALTHHADWPAGIWHAADLQLRLGRAVDAQHTIRALAPSSQHDGRELLRIGQLAIRVRELNVAERISRHLLDRDPEDPQALELAAEIALSTGRKDEATTIADRLASTDRSYAATATAARILFRAGEAKPAMALVERLAEGEPNDVLPIAHALRRHGFLSQAERLLEAATGDDARVDTLKQLVVGSRRTLVDAWRPRSPAKVPLQAVEGRILHITGSSLPHRQSGYTMRTHRTVLAQRASGLEPHVLTYAGFPDDDSVPELETIDEVPHHRIPLANAPAMPVDKRMQITLDGALPVAREIRPSVLHPASDLHNALVALGLREALGIPVVYEVRGFWEETWVSRQPDGCDQSDAYLGRQTVERACMQNADHVVTLSETMKEHIVGRGIDPEKVSVVPNGVDSNAFRPATRNLELAARLEIPPDATVIGCISSLVDYEGFEDLVRAIALLGESAGDVRCLLVGDGPERARLSMVAADLGISDRVILPGRVHHEEILPYYSLIDIFALPRRPHRVCDLVQPLKPFEAMATGCALVVSDREALREMVHDGETGLVAASADPKSLADALGRLVEDRDFRESLGEAALAWVREERSWDRNAATYRQIYSDLLA